MLVMNRKNTQLKFLAIYSCCMRHSTSRVSYTRIWSFIW